MLRTLASFPLLFLLASPLAAQDGLSPDKPITFELKPGEEKELTFVSTVDGEASIWARAPGGDVTLAMKDADGVEIGSDDDSGGLGAAHLRKAIDEGTHYAVVVALKPRDDRSESSLEVTASLVEAVLDDETDELIDRLSAASDAIEKLREAGNLAAGRARGQGAVKLLQEAPGPLPFELEYELDRLGGQAYRCRDLRTASRVWDVLLRSRESSCPPESPALQRSRSLVATTLVSLGDLDRAKRLQELVIDVYRRALPAEHRLLIQIRFNYATTLFELGDLEGARRIEEEVLAAREAVLAPDDPVLQQTRANHAGTLRLLGEIERAKALQEQVLEVFERTLRPDSADLQKIRINYANTLRFLGDHDGARALQEAVLGVYEKQLEPDHPELQMVRMNHANTMRALGNPGAARDILDSVITVYESTLPADHPTLLAALMNLAGILDATGESERAIALERKILEVRERTLGERHPFVQRIRINLARSLAAAGRAAEAQEVEAAALEVCEATLGDAHPDLQRIRVNHLDTLRIRKEIEGADVDEELGSLVGRLVRSARDGLFDLAGIHSARQLSAAASMRLSVLDRALSLGVDDGSVLRDVFLLAQELQSGALRLRRLRVMSTTEDERIDALRHELARRQKDLERALSAPPREEDGGSSRLAESVRAKEIAEIALLRALREDGSAARLLEKTTVEAIADGLPPDAVAVSYIAFERVFLDPDASERPTWLAERHLLAIVMTGEGELSLVDIGPYEPLRERIERYRDLIRGVGPEDRDIATCGRELRRLLLDPVLAAAGDSARRLAVSLADELHLIPLDALPLDDGRRVGDLHRIELTSSLAWLGLPHDSLPSGGRLLAIGGVDFDTSAAPITTEEDIGGVPGHASRGHPAPWQVALPPLPFTETEVRTIAEQYTESFGEEAPAPIVLTGARADELRVRTLAPHARYLHVASHGWFAPESVPSTLDRPSSAGFGIPGVDFREAVHGYEPMSLCGLALTGANRPPGADGRRLGLLNGSEIAALDLSGVELAVLSACDTNVGSVRAGQGVMSLQRALFAAGVRYSLTSLWKVPDEATKELMTCFYEGIWKRGETKREALWNAKLELRNAKDPGTGEPKYGLEDWAGWVLYGNPE